MKINLRIKDWSLRHKIILHVFVIGALASLFLTFLYLSAQNNIIQIFNRRQTELAGSFIQCNLTYLMSSGRQADIPLALKRMAGSTYIQKVRILDKKGQIQHSSDESEKGIAISGDEFEKFGSFDWNEDTQKIYPFHDSGLSQSFIAVRNETSCHSCHDPNQKINGILELQLEDTKINHLLERNRIKSAVVALVALVVFIFIVLRLFEKIINKPLSKLREEMKKVRIGNLDVRVEAKKNDEIGELTHSFNLMVEDLNEARMKIENLHNHQMEKASHLASLGELAAGLAHEIKNPIAGIKSSLEIIYQKTPSENPEKKIFLEILNQTDRIYMIIQDLLSYAKPKPLSRELVDINHTISRALKLARPQIKDKEIDIDFRPLSGDAVFLLDENKIQEVILNLILNSITAIEKTGKITIILSEKKKLAITVKDTGNGIQREHLSKVFSPFFTTSRKGTGLGLSICKRIIEEHNGSIQVYSHLGKGTEFIIKIPTVKKGIV